MIWICDTTTFRSGRSDGIEGDERKNFKVFFVSEKSERGPGCRTNENAPSIGALVPKLRRRLRESSANWFIRAPEVCTTFLSHIFTDCAITGVKSRSQSIRFPPDLTDKWTARGLQTRERTTEEGEACKMPGGDVGRSRHAGTSEPSGA
jgi:hypothetical protein